MVYLTLHVLPDLVHRDVSRSFDEGLHVLVPGSGHKFSHRVEFGELGGVVGIRGASRTQSVTKGKGNIVLGDDVADVVEVFVEEGFAVVDKAPFAHDRATAADDAAEAGISEMDIVAADSGMDGEIVHSLLALFDEGVPVHLPGQILDLPVDFLQSLVDRDGADRDGTVADNPFAGFVNILARRKVHQRVTSPFAAPDSLVHFLFDAGRGCRIADVGVDLHEEIASDDHRFGLRVVDVGREDGTAAGNLAADEFRSDVALYAELFAVHVLTDCDIFHLRSDDSCLCIGHLGDGFSLERAPREPDVLEAQ